MKKWLSALLKTLGFMAYVTVIGPLLIIYFGISYFAFNSTISGVIALIAGIIEIFLLMWINEERRKQLNEVHVYHHN